MFITWLLPLIAWAGIFSMIGKGKSSIPFGIRGGGGGGDEAPKPETVDPTAQALANLQAQQAAAPGAAQVQFDINKRFLGPTTQLQEDVRRDVFGGETDIRDQLLQNVLQSLQSPQQMGPEQQAALEGTRERAQNELVEALRTRANLGGGLFGGRAAGTEQRAVGELQQGFATEDINRMETQRLNNAQLALQTLGGLMPGAQMVQPSFINPVATADTQFQGATSQANLTAQLQNQMQIAQMQAAAQGKSALFKGLGTAVGGALGGPLGASLGSSLGGAAGGGGGSGGSVFGN